MSCIDLTEEEVKFLIRALVSNYASDERDFDMTNIADSGVESVILGKLLSSRDLMDTYDEARKEQTLKEPLNKRLFLGAGNHSIVFLNKLHKRLTYAAHELGGMEQNGGMGTEFDEAFQEDGEKNIKLVINDILIAFGLHNVL